MNPIYKCPVCSKELTKTDNVFVCGQKHSYDISKQGYVNLLLANQKRTKEPGDSKEMIEKREYFLERGYYDTVSDKLNEIISGFIDESPAPDDDNTMNILDLGCGEGFYSAKLRADLEAKKRKQIQLCGIDISKAAIHKAAKRSTDVQYCIGSNFQLPYMNESLDIIFSIFSPFNPKETLRVLKPGGKLIVVRAGTNHLKELASLIYEKFELQGNSSSLAENLDLQPVQTFEVKYQIHLKNTRDIESLVGMTPYFWTLNEEKKSLLTQQQELTTTVDFQFSIFRK